MKTRPVDDLDGSAFEVEDLPAQPAIDCFTLRMYRRVQHEFCMAFAHWRRPMVHRLERIERYLIKRYNRDDTPEEQEVYATIWGPVEVAWPIPDDLGGES